MIFVPLCYNRDFDLITVVRFVAETLKQSFVRHVHLLREQSVSTFVACFLLIQQCRQIAG